MLAITVGTVVVRSKTTIVLLALPTNMVLPSAVTTTPQGQESGFTPLAREAQHCAPVKPPKRPLGPKPGNENDPVRQAKRVKFPASETSGGITGRQALALLPACATSFAPPIVLMATFLIVSTTTTSRPMRSET